MLKLLRCEWWKLRRKHWLLLVAAAAWLFPVPLTAVLLSPRMQARYTDAAEAFGGLFSQVMGFGVQFLLPCVLGVLAAVLFFMERDNDTFKSLRPIPVTSTEMVAAKIFMLFFFGVVFCLSSTLATVACGALTMKVTGVAYKCFLAVETGLFITAGTLPLVVAVVLFSRTMIFSVLLCIFYSVLNLSATALYDVLPRAVLWLLPMPLTLYWSGGKMTAHGIPMNIAPLEAEGLIPSTPVVVAILGAMALVSVVVMVRVYRREA